MPCWHTREPKMVLLLILIVASCGIVALTIYVGRAVTLAEHGGFFSDFAAQWSFGRFAAAGRGAEIYDADALHRFQFAQTGVEHDYPFP